MASPRVDIEMGVSQSFAILKVFSRAGAERWPFVAAGIRAFGTQVVAVPRRPRRTNAAPDFMGAAAD